ncbi:ATP-binding cassette domain-containing protein [Halanaerobium salsuginis]|uniref:ATP-binding cassette, subfamily F, member 3 n=1 Tax=Halanaerobium salsuginis TaxID=29563 RepID=A0A1I4KA36_9FIRM|nr:ATP-binding cassette domain-containing protein [Halanaerobium salsuginis]SFL75634.1 ATP-binding cassette, subfamily F, member 3 [Halanaerobium salsuginis]
MSIGERVRVAFTILLLSQANFLLLDEPLNHLDIESRQRIETALAEYDGAFLTVTHDRYFAKNQVNKIWQLDQTGLEIFSGNYQQYLDQQEIEASAGPNFETELKRMKRAELVARLEKAVDPVEIKKLENELAEL